MPNLNVSDLVKERLGVKTIQNINPVTATLGATATPILRQNFNRVWALICNMSANTMYVGPFPNPSTTQGIILAAGGGMIALDYTTDFELLGLEWSGVASGAGSALLVVEQLTTR